MILREAIRRHLAHLRSANCVTPNDLEGDSIPIAHKFQSQLSKPVILLGSRPPEDNIHLGSSPALQQR